MSDAPSRVARRDVLRGGVALVVFGAAACSRKPQAPFTCTDASALSPDDAKARETLAYVEPAPNLQRRCGTCQQYVAPPAGEGCGGCKVLKGPIHPNGTCKAYAPSMM